MQKPETDYPWIKSGAAIIVFTCLLLSAWITLYVAARAIITAYR